MPEPTKPLPAQAATSPRSALAIVIHLVHLLSRHLSQPSPLLRHRDAGRPVPAHDILGAMAADPRARRDARLPASFAADTARAAESLRPLMEFAKEKVGGEGAAAATEVRLMATVGLRLLEESVREAILVSCRNASWPPGSVSLQQHVHFLLVLMKASMLGLRQTMLWAHLECRSSSLMMMQEGKEKCEHQQCHLGSNFVPQLLGHFLATEKFYFTSKFFGLDRSSSLSDSVVAGEQLCNKDMSMLKQKYLNHSDEDFSRYCFSSAYIVALLHDSLGVPLDDKRQAYHTRTPSFFLS
ncbi:hypothetical protein ZWY2020_034707 [Hordeum vulgare]|nr:hypothetical protein ZWY2020_034707 [Hordeum vulgare]